MPGLRFATAPGVAEARIASIHGFAECYENPVHATDDDLVCERCTGIKTLSGCYGCDRARRYARNLPNGGALADRVICLSYACDNQLQVSAYNYKRALNEALRLPAHKQMAGLVWAFTAGHLECFLEVSSIPPSLVAVVPSGDAERARLGNPKLRKLLDFCPPEWQEVMVRRTRSAEGRSMSVSSLELAEESHDVVPERHVVVFDDTWTTGASAESVAALMKQHGAAEVTILVVARWLNSGFDRYSAFRAAHHVPNPAWTPAICPIDGSRCGRGLPEAA